jgi:hypothetical protein
MGNTPSLDEIQVFYDDEYEIKPELVRNTIEVSEIPVVNNEMLWSYAKNNVVVLFMHAKRGTGINAFCDLRHKTMTPEPMAEYEYLNTNNEYCQCLVYNPNERNFMLMGFILYRIYEGTMYLLDIVFCYDQYIWDQLFPELHNVNVPLSCIGTFNNFVLKLGYPCYWRKSIVLDKILKKRIKRSHTYKPKVYKSLGLQYAKRGTGKLKIVKPAIL